MRLSEENALPLQGIYLTDEAAWIETSATGGCATGCLDGSGKPSGQQDAVAAACRESEGVLCSHTAKRAPS